MLERPASAPLAPSSAGAEPDDVCAALVSAAQAGDRAAFARLHDLFAPLVHGVLLARVARHDADDLTQEVFVRAWRKIGKVRDGAAVGAWLASIARRAAATHRRRGWARAFVSLLVETPSARPARSAGLEVDEVLAAIRALPGAYREPLVLRLVEQMTGPQIAARLGMTHASVRVNLSKGMSLLRERLRAEIEA